LPPPPLLVLLLLLLQVFARASKYSLFDPAKEMVSQQHSCFTKVGTLQ
jgi:ATP/ADP translocase